ncbi:MAG: hypothetical protein SNF33_03000 [Candidatus Algichlamydia australiensis]|nr:hypothetical protein [Chlamydiales bacterium]
MHLKQKTNMGLSTYSSIATPFLSIRMYERERTIRAGGNRYLPLLMQILQLSTVINFVNESDVLTPLFGRAVKLNSGYFIMAEIAFGVFLHLSPINKQLKTPTIVPEKTIKGVDLENKKFVVVIPSHKKNPTRVSNALSRAITPLANQFDESTPVSRTALRIFNNISNFSMIVLFATSFGLIAKGERRKGATILGIFAAKGAIETANSLDRIAEVFRDHKFTSTGDRIKSFSDAIAIPLSRIRYHFNSISKRISVVRAYTTLYTGDELEKFFSVLDLANDHFGNLVYRIYKWSQGEKKDAYVKQKLYSPVENLNHCEVDETHIQQAIILPPEPDLNLEKSLIELYDKTTFSDQICLDNQEDKKLMKKIMEGVVKNTPESIRAYAKDGIRLFIRGVIWQKPIAGKMRSQMDYDRVRIMTKCLVEKFQNSKDPKQKPYIDRALFTLGLLGHYCSAGYFRVLEPLYSSFVESKSTDRKTKILNLLRNTRHNILDGNFLQKTNPLQASVEDPNDIDYRNQTLLEDYWLANEPPTFGAQAEYGNNLSWISVGVRYLQFKPLENRRKLYTPQTICEAINEDLANERIVKKEETEEIQRSQVPMDDYLEWFVMWLMIRKNYKNRDDAVKFFNDNIKIEEEIAPNNEGEDWQYRYTIKENYLRLMLVELGILKVPEDSPYLKK